VTTGPIAGLVVGALGDPLETLIGVTDLEFGADASELLGLTVIGTVDQFVRELSAASD
jgi:hypothetical protein